MVDVIKLLLPNFNLVTFIGILALVLGVIILVISMIYLRGLGRITKLVNTIGAVMVVFGLVFWFGVSFIQDIFADPKLLTGLIALIVVAGIGLMLFMPKLPKGKKRRK